MKADPDVIAVTAKPFPEPELYVLAVDLANIALSGRNGGATAYEDVYQELAKRVGPAMKAGQLMRVGDDDVFVVYHAEKEWDAALDRLRGIRAALEPR